ncbi:Rough colony protein B [Mannheimia granulomatis]|uniref:Rough colony protein B n=1 Tax=Mannheimia granulomatis TaxID=85402 RepID=UPI00159DCAA9|nr:Rough colony protein B [Mannheimia granulomatis]QLB14976.1 Rough colony protein B [Mannheimia granulomatis]
MRRLLTLCSILSLSLPLFAKNNTELLSNIRPAQPTNSEIVTHKSLNIKRLVLADFSAVAIENLLTEIKRHATSTKDEQTIHLISLENRAKDLAKELSKRLKSEKIKNMIYVEHRKTTNSLYPLYVEIHQTARKMQPCKSDTAEDHMSFDPYKACTLKHNNKLQLIF